jgi:hypothetical protein
MIEQEPLVELVPAFSSPNAVPTGWVQARRDLQAAPVFWLSTVPSFDGLRIWQGQDVQPDAVAFP